MMAFHVNDLIVRFSLILILLKIKECAGKNVCISTAEGQDVSSCGTSSFPCASYQYASLNDVIENNDVILLSGVESKSPLKEALAEINYSNLTFIATALTIQSHQVSSSSEADGKSSESPVLESLDLESQELKQSDSKYKLINPSWSLMKNSSSLFRLSNKISVQSPASPELTKPSTILVTLVGFKLINITILDLTEIAEISHQTISLHLVDCWIGQNVIFTTNARNRNKYTDQIKNSSSTNNTDHYTTNVTKNEQSAGMKSTSYVNIEIRNSIFDMNQNLTEENLSGRINIRTKENKIQSEVPVQSNNTNHNLTDELDFTMLKKNANLNGSSYPTQITSSAKKDNFPAAANVSFTRNIMSKDEGKNILELTDTNVNIPKSRSINETGSDREQNIPENNSSSDVNVPKNRSINETGIDREQNIPENNSSSDVNIAKNRSTNETGIDREQISPRNDSSVKASNRLDESGTDTIDREQNRQMNQSSDKSVTDLIPEYKTPITRLVIRDSTFISGAVYLEHPMTLHIQNVTFKPSESPEQPDSTAKNGDLIHINGKAGNYQNVTIDQLFIIGDHQKKTALRCFYCNLQSTEIQFKNTSVHRGFLVHRVIGFIDNIELTNVKISHTFSHTSQCDIQYRQNIIIRDSHICGRIFVVNGSSQIYMNNFQMMNTISTAAVITSVNHSLIDVQNLRIQNSTCLNLGMIKYSTETIRVADEGHLIINSGSILNSEFYQVFLAYNAQTESQNKSAGTISVSNMVLKQNNVKSTLIGLIKGRNCTFRNLNITQNSAENILHTNQSKVYIRDMNILQNNYQSGFIVQESDFDIEDVVFDENQPQKDGKALIYESEYCRKIRTVRIHNMYVSIVNHLLHDPKSAIIDIDINKSILQMKNVVVNIQSMNYSKVAAIHLKFVTLSPNVLSEDHGTDTPAVKLICPESYFPFETQKLRANFFTHVIDCVPCPRGLYNLHRGISDIRYVNNADFDTTMWKNGNRKLLIENQPDIRKCIKCPPGGNCTYGIKSQGNHFGQCYSDQHHIHNNNNNNNNNNITKESEVTNNWDEAEEKNRIIEFISCPPGYCCSNQGQRCHNITSCNFNRQGILCGQCSPGYHQSYFSSICMENSKCNVTSQRTFWIVYFFTALILTLVILITKDAAILFATFFLQVKKQFARYKRRFSGKTTDHKRKTRINSCISYKNIRIKNKCLLKEDEPPQYIFSAVLQITLSFFQIVSLLSVRNDSDTNKTLTRMINLFNLQLVFKQAEDLCPYETVDSVWKDFLKNVVFIFLMLFLLVVFSLIHNLTCFLFCGKNKTRPQFSQRDAKDTEKNMDIVNQNKIDKSTTINIAGKPKIQQDKNIAKSTLINELLQTSFTDKLILTFIKILMFGYKNISLFTIVSLNCVNVYGKPVLYISGNIQCYQPWQYALLALLILWVVPFPVALILTYRLYQKGTINRPGYIISLLFPMLAFGLYYYYRGTRSWTLGTCEDEGLLSALSDIFEEPYRVVREATVDGEIEEETLYWWTAWRLYERLFIAILVTFIIEPLFRMCVVAPVMVFLSLIHYQIKPYKETMTLLSLLDISSYVFLTFYVVDNMFRSFAYTFDLPLQNPIDRGLKILGVFETLLTPLTVICLFVIASVLEALYELIKNATKKNE